MWRRRIATRGPIVAFCMLNPSTADELIIDPTVTRVCGYASAWGCSEAVVLNLHALRSTDPGVLYEHYDPIGPENDEYIRRTLVEVAASGGFVVCAWGEHGKYRNRADEVYAIMREVGLPTMCLRINKGGEPSHPLYLPRGLKPVAYER